MTDRRSFIEVDVDAVDDEAIDDYRSVGELFIRLEFDELLYGSSFLTFVDGEPRRVDPTSYIHRSPRDDVDEEDTGDVEPPDVDPLFDKGDVAAGETVQHIHDYEQAKNETPGNSFGDTQDLAQNGGLVDAGSVAPTYGTAPTARADSFIVDSPQIDSSAIEAAVERIAERNAVRECMLCGLLIRPVDVEWVDGKARCPTHGVPISIARRDK